MYAAEGLPWGSPGNYTVTVAFDVAFPVTLVAFLSPAASLQGEIAAYVPDLDGFGIFSAKMYHTFQGPGEVLTIGFSAKDDGIVEGVHSVDIQHARVAGKGVDPASGPALGIVQAEISDANFYMAGFSAMDPSGSFTVEGLTLIEGGDSLVVPVRLNAATDQEVSVALFAELASRLKASVPSLVFPPGDPGPLSFNLTAPEDGRTLGDLLTTLTLRASSVSAGYNDLVDSVPVTILEIRNPGILVEPPFVPLLAINGYSATFEVALTSEPSAAVSLFLSDPTGAVAFFPASISLPLGLASLDRVQVRASKAQAGYEGNVSVSVHAASELDSYYNGISSGLVMGVENRDPPGIRVSPASGAVTEGSTLKYQVALATAPTAPVQVLLALTWGTGQPAGHQVTITPSVLEFAAGREAQVWQEVRVYVAADPGFVGDSLAVITHAASSTDRLYDSSNSEIGAAEAQYDLRVIEANHVGVCLANCFPVTKYDFLFMAGDSGEVRTTPYEVKADGGVPLDVLLSSQPLGQVELEVTAALPGGNVSLVTLLGDEDSSGSREGPDSPDSSRQQRSLLQRSPSPTIRLTYGNSTWSMASQMKLYAAIDRADLTGSGEDHLVYLTVKCSSPTDWFYDGLEFSFTVYVTPAMNAPAVSMTVASVTTPTKIVTTDLMGVTFQPNSLPVGTAATILPVKPDELNCSLTSTRFQPFGYKEVVFDPPLEGDIDPPARLYWQIPERLKDLSQLKFLTAPNPTSCDWSLRSNISVEERGGTMSTINSETGKEEWWAYLDVNHFSVYALAKVVPLVSPDIPANIAVKEDSNNPVAINPNLSLDITGENGWNEKFPNLRIIYMNVTIVEGYERGKDRLTMREAVPGFDSEWIEADGVLQISAATGFDFTENIDDDYDSGALEFINVQEFIDSTPAAARLAEFNAALRVVGFETTILGRSDRIMELSIQELLTAQVLARISWASVLNSPDPPDIIFGPDGHNKGYGAWAFVEKAELQPVDPELVVFHQDFRRIQNGSVWMETVADSDILLFQQPAGGVDGDSLFNTDLVVALDPDTRGWSISGLADPEEYSKIFRVRSPSLRTQILWVYCLSNAAAE